MIAQSRRRRIPDNPDLADASFVACARSQDGSWPFAAAGLSVIDP